MADRELSMSVHAVCTARTTYQGTLLQCRRSPEHVNSSKGRRYTLHFTPDHDDLLFDDEGNVFDAQGNPLRPEGADSAVAAPKADLGPAYPVVTVTYLVQYQTSREPGVWWDANVEPFKGLPAALEFSGRLNAGFEKPRGNPRAFVTDTRIVQKVSTETVVQGEGAPGYDETGVAR